MNEPENVLRNFEKPFLKRQAEEENGTKKIKNIAKCKKIMNVGLKLRDKEALKRKKWPTDSDVH